MTIFGDGWDIWINDNCNLNDSFTNFPSSYECMHKHMDNEVSRKYLSGGYNFRVEEIEVYYVFRKI